jgi:SMC interacting uncharacterized protein involved in chromosome segregation
MVFPVAENAIYDVFLVFRTPFLESISKSFLESVSNSFFFRNQCFLPHI